MSLRSPRRGVLLLVLLLLAPAARGDQRERELEDLRRAIEERRERLARFEREQRGLLETLEEIDRLAADLAADAARGRREAEAARARLVGLERRTGELEVQLAATKRAMAGRADALYRSGEVGPVQVLFAAGDLPELLARIEGLRRLLEHDRRLLARYHAERAELVAARDEAKRTATRRAQAVALAETRSRELERERRGKRELNLRVRADRGRERGVLIELEKAARTLEETLARLPDASRGGTTRPGRGPSFASLKGRLESPVAAPVLREFGRVVDDEFHTQLFLKGVDFEAPFGMPVRAVASGRVRFAGWFRGYGRLLILDHGEDFFTVCGHLDEIRVEVGEVVRRGQPIGTVGDTGSLSGPRLYFEIRRGGEPLDPGEWLLAGKTG